MSDSKFDVESGEEFYITISDSATVCESFDDAAAEVADKISEDDDAFVAKASLDGSGEDMEFNVEQVEWHEIIPEITDD
jgi:hypothetical protein